MSGPRQPLPPVVSGALIEIALILAGLVLLWRLAISPTARRERAIRLTPWDIRGIDFACFLSFIFMGAFLPSYLAAQYVAHLKVEPAVVTIVGAAFQNVGVLLGVFGFYALIGNRVGSRFGPFDFGRSLRTGLATFLVAFPVVEAVSLGWGFLLERMGVSTEKQELLRIFEGLDSPVLRDVFVALAILLVPPAEEIIFRGCLFRYFRTRLPRWVAILATSLLFASLHGAWISLLPLTALACIFCLAYERTGLIGTTIVAHALFNLNTVFLIVTGIGT